MDVLTPFNVTYSYIEDLASKVPVFARDLSLTHKMLATFPRYLREQVVYLYVDLDRYDMNVSVPPDQVTHVALLILSFQKQYTDEMTECLAIKTGCPDFRNLKTNTEPVNRIRSNYDIAMHFYDPARGTRILRWFNKRGYLDPFSGYGHSSFEEGKPRHFNNIQRHGSFLTRPGYEPGINILQYMVFYETHYYSPQNTPAIFTSDMLCSSKHFPSVLDFYLSSFNAIMKNNANKQIYTFVKELLVLSRKRRVSSEAYACLMREISGILSETVCYELATVNMFATGMLVNETLSTILACQNSTSKHCFAVIMRYLASGFPSLWYTVIRYIITNNVHVVLSIKEINGVMNMNGDELARHST